jgi:hypothetical protein
MSGEPEEVAVRYCLRQKVERIRKRILQKLYGYRERTLSIPTLTQDELSELEMSLESERAKEVERVAEMDPNDYIKGVAEEITRALKHVVASPNSGPESKDFWFRLTLAFTKLGAYMERRSKEGKDVWKDKVIETSYYGLHSVITELQNKAARNKLTDYDLRRNIDMLRKVRDVLSKYEVT